MPEPMRYLRNHTAVSEAEQELLGRKRVLVAGCGGLGGYVIELLARLGVGRITAVDDDVFDETNLNRQLFATVEALGQPKAEAARRRVEAVNPLVRVEAVRARIGLDNVGTLLAGHDLAVDALDNIPARLLLEDAAQEQGLPLIHGAIAGWCGHVASVLPGDRLLHGIYGGIPADSAGAEVRAGCLGFAAAATAALQAAEAAKVLLGRGELRRHQLLEMDLLRNRMEIISLK